MKRAKQTKTGWLYQPVFRTAGGEKCHQETWWWRPPTKFGQKRQSTGKRDRAEAEQWVLTTLAEWGLNPPPLEPTPAPKVFAYTDAKDVLMSYYVSKGRNTSIFKGRIVHLDKFFITPETKAQGGITIVEMCDAGLIEKFMVKERGANRPVNTINRDLRFWRRMLKRAAARGMLDRGLIPPTSDDDRGCWNAGEGNIRRDMLSADDTDRIIADMNAWHAAAISGCRETGWRLSEVLGFRWERIRWDSREIILDRSKTGPGLFRFSMWPKLTAVMEQQWAIHQELLGQGIDCPWVFPCLAPGYVGKKISKWSIQRVWKTVVRRLGVAGTEGAYIHGLRRAMVHRLAMWNVPLKTIMEVTRHRSLKTIEGYLMTLGSDLDRAGTMLNDGESGQAQKTEATQTLLIEMLLKQIADLAAQVKQLTMQVAAGG